MRSLAVYGHPMHLQLSVDIVALVVVLVWDLETRMVESITSRGADTSAARRLLAHAVQFSSFALRR